MSERINIAVIGGGIVGCCIAHELSKNMDDIYVFEKNTGITQGENQTSRNSGVNHAGLIYDRASRPLKAQLCVEGNRLWYEFCERYDLPCVKTGKLMLAADESGSAILDDYLQRARQNGVAGVRKINADQIRTHEPNVRAHSALLVPTSGVFEPTTLLYKVFVLAGNRGVNFLTATEVLSLQNAEDVVILTFRYRDGRQDTIAASRVINAAGLQAVELARSSDADLPIRSALVRGDSYKFYRNARAELYLRGMNVYPTPLVVETPTGCQQTVGVHLTPTFDTANGKIVIGDTVTVGPRLVPVKHLEDYRTPVPAAAEFVKDLEFFPGLQAADLQFHQGGIQARLNGYPDFYIQADRRCSRILNLLGIDSPGLTAAPAIAKYVAAMMER